ncbi:MAG: hypothetical protein A3H70_01800 [Candidatus Komeilibacteria bacterium RIFCSPLOWO2_02_FULL_48_11]|uniref:Uncharacterized protein n=1 Tax=Candidatus Komeilibacteria bacterium RIFCSPLOWO2_02_FULL_48_11 TaxID=1798553 RepID=A0A1G2BQS9_9BACT|nr:MAG: hypothetical protein A3H70_01800 [Candidatus Komeilibacteria bacterium RIFCSPLOWO2_02_FULL_48_11]
MIFSNLACLRNWILAKAFDSRERKAPLLPPEVGKGASGGAGLSVAGGGGGAAGGVMGVSSAIALAEADSGGVTTGGVDDAAGEDVGVSVGATGAGGMPGGIGDSVGVVVIGSSGIVI